MSETFWALIALIIFIGVVIYVKAPAMVTKSLDDRAERIRNELEEARKLREEAQQILAEYQRKRKEAEQEAADILVAAKREAEILVKDAKRKTEEYVERRTALAEQKIEQAERDAAEEVRTRAVEIAVAAASSILAGKVEGKVASDLFKASVSEVKSNLN